jgi:flagellar hook assembly protein FlgD
MKKLLWIALVVIALIAVFVIFVFSNLNSLVAKAIEKNGSEVTQTSVSVIGIDISLREGSGSIKGLHIASPEGFEAKNVFSLDDITVGIDIQSLRDEPIVITKILIKAPVIYAEITKTGSSNIDEIRKNVQEYMPQSTEGSEGAEKQAKRVLIRQFIFEKGSIEVDASALGLEKRTVVLPEIKLENVGGPEGATPDEITKIILATVVKKAASEIGGSEINRLIEEKLGGEIKDKAKSLFNKITN